MLIKVCSQLTNSACVTGKTFSLSCGDSLLHREAWETTVRNEGSARNGNILPSNALAAGGGHCEVPEWKQRGNR